MLEQLGLSKTEARVYHCLLTQSPLAAATIADRTGTARSNVYLILRSLVDQGLIEAGAGYNSRYHALRPDDALQRLLDRSRAELASRERHVEAALPELAELYAKHAGADEGEIVEILRTPKLIGERFERLQAEARESIDIVVRGPIQVGGSNAGEVAALRRGVRARAIYDQTVLDDPAIGGRLSSWIASGEQAKVYPGELPMKFALFDGCNVVMPMVTPGVAGVVAIIVRNRELAAALGMLFETLWVASEALPAPSGRRRGDGLVVDPSAHEASWFGVPLPLTTRELLVLDCLAGRLGKVWTYEQLHARAWDGHYVGPAAVQSVVKRLRAKLREADVTLRVGPVRGVGFRLLPPDPVPLGLAG